MAKDNRIDDVLITPRELAAEFGVNVATIARWRKKGCPCVESHPHSMGRYTRPRYNVARVIAWLENSKAGAKG